MTARRQSKTARSDARSSTARTPHLELADLADRVEAVSTPLLKSKSLPSMIDSLVLMSCLHQLLDKQVRALRETLRPLLPLPKTGETLICNGMREHIEFASVCQSSIDPARLAKSVSLKELCQCVQVLLGETERTIGKAKADRLKDREWVSQMRVRRGRHPSPDFDSRRRA